ncbi:MAG: DUF4197 domain-containing protein [Lysobacterales bacterium]
MKRLILLLTSATLLSSGIAQADLKDKLKGLLGDDEQTETEQAADNSAAAPEAENDSAFSLSSLSSDQQVAGLKQALEQGLTRAITALGQTDGFWNSETVRIPLPEGVDKVAKTARKLGADRYVDEFHETLNRAAEGAVPVATDLFAAALTEMTIEDAVDIIRGDDDAATQYFRAKTENSLSEQFLPLVTDATDQAGVTQAYKALNKKAGGFLSALGGDEEDLDLDRYVTAKALDGLFVYIAAEEKQIREDPVARTTDLLKALFD